MFMFNKSNNKRFDLKVKIIKNKRVVSMVNVFVS